MTNTQKIQIFEIQNPKNTPLIFVCIYAKSTPWEIDMNVDFFQTMTSYEKPCLSLKPSFSI